MRRVRIISNGTPAGTRMVDADSCEDLRIPVTGITWSIDAEQASIATVQIPLAELDVLTDLVEEESDDADR